MGSSLVELPKQLRAAKLEVEASAETLNDETRKTMLKAAKALTAALEKPEEVIMHYAYHLGSQRWAIRIAIDLGIFGFLAESDGKPVIAEKIAESAKAEKLLVERILRVLAAIHFVAETGRGIYVANVLTKAMSDPVTQGVLTTSYDLPSRVQVSMHECFKERGYASPTDGLDCPMQWTLNKKQHYWDYIQSDQHRLSAFNAMMTRIRSTRKHWTEWYPVDSNILDGTSADDSAVLVDIGGAKGHDLLPILERYPSTSGRLVLQDLPGTIESINSLQDGIKAMSHDFFKKQPIKGARVYYMHFVMHDWPDEKCRDILRQIIPAMRPGYSKILLNEVVLPDKDCPPEFASADINMMSVLAGIERTQTHWIELIESAGLKVEAVHKSPYEGDSEGVVEIM